MSELTYKGELTRAMELLAADPESRFIGYGLLHGRAMGTMRGVPAAQIIETPVAENLMVGMATGLSLAGFKPLVFIERCDFLLNAADALVNHLDKIGLISKGEFRPAAIIRVVVGNKVNGLMTGATHTQDFSKAFASMLCCTDVFWATSPADVAPAYQYALARMNFTAVPGEPRRSTVIFEYKDLM